MVLSPSANKHYAQINSNTKLGDLRKMAKEIKKDHEIAMELWSTGEFLPRQLAILIMDKKLLSQAIINELDNDIQNHKYDERTHLIDWLMANQLSKDKTLVNLMLSWKDSSSTLQRRVFWYYQARLRWTGNTDHTNTEELLSTIEKNMIHEQPEVQWAMNFTAGQIGKFQEEYRAKCIAIGEKAGLYKDEVAVKGCTPNYLPKFISIEVAKLNKNNK
ncbi:DNA alkylation repair protein [Tenacibaculum amylolyticum]|uniref:DNA alkylation repair protein n=1 Tax=Tenacibaculum amylolyticum TaxID=104269 RepID=UPI003894DD70